MVVQKKTMMISETDSRNGIGGLVVRREDGLVAEFPPNNNRYFKIVCPQNIGHIQGKIGQSHKNHGQGFVEETRVNDGGSRPNHVDKDIGRPAVRHRGQDGR